MAEHNNIKEKLITVNRYASKRPLVTAFVYHPGGNNVIKGPKEAVIDYIDDHYNKCFYNLLSIHSYTTTSQWRTSKRSGFSIYKNISTNKRRYIFRIKRSSLIFMVLRKIPKRWIPELDFIPNNNW